MGLNPYVPTDAIPPPLFAGRKEVLQRAAELEERARHGIHGGLLLAGHRGIGKTSTLRAVEAGLGKGVALVRLRFSRRTSLEQFAAELVGTVRAQEPAWRERFGLREVELPFLTVRIEPRARGEATPQVAVLETLRALRRVAVLWLSLDDFDWVDGDAMSLLKSAMEGAGSPTVVVCVAGGPKVRQRMISEHSPIVRFFSGSDFDLANFTHEETREALALPLDRRGIGGRWEDDAVVAVHRWTGGYPYLVQCLAHAAFSPGAIGRANVEAALPAALRIAGTWMDRELASASDQDIRYLDRIGRAQRNEWRASELVEIGLNPLYLRRLERLGALRKVSRGRYEVVKPPMVARFHMWKRGLEESPKDEAGRAVSPNP
jgi:hypothetical protein